VVCGEVCDLRRVGERGLCDGAFEAADDWFCDGFGGDLGFGFVPEFQVIAMGC
jgi:hypothetical protein